jgi:hypothetical protein
MFEYSNRFVYHFGHNDYKMELGEVGLKWGM